MSAFSRGCLLRHQCAFKTPRTAHFFLSKSYEQPRFFASTTSMQATKKFRSSQPIKQVMPKKKTSNASSSPPTPTQAPAPIVPIGYKSYAMSLAEKPHSTLLYQAPSHTVYMLTCYGTAGFCFAYATISFWSNYLLAPPDLPTWVPVAFGGISLLMACLGGWVVLAPAGLVKSIVAIPSSVRVANGALAKPGGPTLQIEVELKKMLPVPFFPSRKFYVKPEEIELSHRFVPVNKKVSIEEAKERAMLIRMARERELQYERSHIMTSPFRRMSQLSFKMFTELKRVWTRDQMLKMVIHDRSYKVDISGGWALDGGRALDRLAKIKP
ncbi:hypothetical protein BKA65DRAFT_493128 [Rhexocercosporidium sp. MPI-PUGE-AT-0058]|nr:hypothetical protein BKA65DRAFT_493128 [Rhexocercosporidium sp. MPI-PUGE-AT-0058]